MLVKQWRLHLAPLALSLTFRVHHQNIRRSVEQLRPQMLQLDESSAGPLAERACGIPEQSSALTLPCVT